MLDKINNRAFNKLYEERIPMRNLCQSIMLILVFIIPILYSCAPTQKEKAEPRDVRFYKNRGMAYGKKGQYDKAISDYNEALQINPKGVWDYGNRGNAYYQKGQYDQAISDYNKALEINPRDALAYYRRANSYLYQKQYDKSWEDVNRAQGLGLTIPPEFLDYLRKDSGGKK